MKKTIGIVVAILFIISLLQVIPFQVHHSSNQVEKTISKQVKEDNTEASIKISAISFYMEYDKCINDPSQTVSSCLKENPNSGSLLVKDEISSKEDPIFCSDTFPDTYSVTKNTIKDDSSQVEVIESIAGSSQRVLLTLGKENNKWKVQKVSCPKV